MIIWGSRTNVIGLGETGDKPCPTCDKVRRFHHILQYRYGHLYYIFGAVMEEQHVEACEVCRRGRVIPKAEAKAAMAKNPIPFTHRLGWTIAAALVLLIIIVSSIPTK